MKKYIYIAISVIFIVLIILLCSLTSQKNKYFDEYQRTMGNLKATQSMVDSLSSDNIMYQMTISELNYSNDSITKELMNLKKQKKIKNKNLISMAYLESSASRVDTIKFPDDTIFRDKEVCIDTTITDKWYKLTMNLEYPSTIIVNPTFYSEKYIIASYKKETIAPPKKCWLLRLFQKKHKVIRVEVVEKNPFIKSKKNKFIYVTK